MDHLDGPLKDDRWIRSLAVRVLIEAGKLSDARAALASLLRDSPSGQCRQTLVSNRTSSCLIDVPVVQRSRRCCLECSTTF